MCDRTIFGLSSSSKIGDAGFEGKYVLKQGDSMQGDLVMEDAGITVQGAMSSVLLEGGAGLRVQDGGGILVTSGQIDTGSLVVQDGAEVKGLITTTTLNVLAAAEVKGNLVTASIDVKGGGGINVLDAGDVLIDGKLTVNQDIFLTGFMECKRVDASTIITAQDMKTITLDVSDASNLTGIVTCLDHVLVQSPDAILTLKNGAKLRIEDGGGMNIDGKSEFKGDVICDTKLEIKGDVKVEGKLDVKLDVSTEGDVVAVDNVKAAGVMAIDPDIKISTFLGLESKEGIKVIGKSLLQNPINVTGNVFSTGDGFTFGWQFTVGVQDIILTQFRYISINMSSDRTVGIYDVNTGNLLRSAVVLTSDPPNPTNEWRVHDLVLADYVTLQANTVYMIAAFIPVGGNIDAFGTFGSPTINSTYINTAPIGRAVPSASLSFPTNPYFNAFLNCSFGFIVPTVNFLAAYSGDVQATTLKLLQQPAHTIYSSLNGELIPFQTDITITVWNNSVVDVGGITYNNGSFNVQVAGMYLVFYTVRWDSIAGIRNSEVIIDANPERYARILFTDAGGSAQGTTLNGSDVLRLEPGNTVSVRVWQSNASSIQVRCMDDAACHFGIICLYRL